MSVTYLTNISLSFLYYQNKYGKANCNTKQIYKINQSINQ